MMTVSSSVTTAARISGINVSSMSLNLRSMMLSRVAIESSASRRPRERRGRWSGPPCRSTPVPPWRPVRPSARRGQRRAASLRRRTGPWGDGQALSRRPACDHSFTSSGGRLASVTCSAVNASRSWSSSWTSGATIASRAASRSRGPALASAVSASARRVAPAMPCVCPALCGSCAASRSRSRDLVQGVAISASLGAGCRSVGTDRVLERWRRSWGSAASFSSCWVGIMFERAHGGDLWNLREPRRRLVGRGERRARATGCRRSPAAVALEVEVGGDRFRARVAQMDGVEIEFQPVEQRQAAVTTSAMPMMIGLRCRDMNASTGARLA